MTHVQKVNLVDQANQLDTINVNDTDLLHIKPLCHQFCRSITYIGTQLQQKYPQNPHALRFAKVVVATGYILNTLIATVEFVAALSLATLALTINTIIRSRSEWFQKMTLKICAYCINIVFVGGIQIVCLYKRFFSPYHTFNALVNHGAHIASAVASQTLLGYTFDQWVDRNPINNEQNSPSHLRTIRIFIETLPGLIIDAANSAVLDFARHIQNNRQQHDIENYLQRHPDYAALINQFTLERVRTDEAYRLSLLNILGSFLAEAGIFQRILGSIQGGDSQQVYGVSRHPADMKYKEELVKIVKESYLELYYDPALIISLNRESEEDIQKILNEKNKDEINELLKQAMKELKESKDDEKNDEGINKLLKQAIKNGREQLEVLAFEELANFAQLKEIEKEEMLCPEKFHDRALEEVKDRFKLLMEVRECLRDLKKNESNKKEWKELRPILVEKLLKLDKFDILSLKNLDMGQATQLHELFKKMGSLALQLHKGSLLSEQTVDLNLLVSNNPFEAYSTKHLFQVSCAQAKEEINDAEKIKSSQ
jgi:hypothetical protein